MSFIFIIAFITLLLLPLTCISILFSLRSNHRSRISSTATIGGNDVVVRPPRRYAGRQEECGVCLSEVEEGEEIGGLRCSHVFHKACMEAWVASGHATCPLCRGQVFAPMVAEDGASEVVMFRFCSFGSSGRAGREDSWWLR